MIIRIDDHQSFSEFHPLVVEHKLIRFITFLKWIFTYIQSIFAKFIYILSTFRKGKILKENFDRNMYLSQNAIYSY